jgi:hypothetical protein
VGARSPPSADRTSMLHYTARQVYVTDPSHSTEGLTGLATRGRLLLVVTDERWSEPLA